MSVRQYPSPPPRKWLEIPEGWGFSKTKKFKEMYELEEFGEGWRIAYLWISSLTVVFFYEQMVSCIQLKSFTDPICKQITLSTVTTCMIWWLLPMMSHFPGNHLSGILATFIAPPKKANRSIERQYGKALRLHLEMLKTYSNIRTAIKKYLIAPNTIKGLNLSFALFATKMKYTDNKEMDM